MKEMFYSDKVKRYFDNKDECIKAEKEYDEKEAKANALREERATRAHEVEDAYKKYLDLKAKFIEDYKSYHITLTDKDLPALNKLATSNIWDIFNDFWF